MVTPDTLSRIGLFTGLSDGQLTALTDLCEERICRQGELLFREGEKAEHLHILLEGKVSIQVQLTSRPASVTVAVISGPDQVIGWSGLVSPYHYTASAVCQTDGRLLTLHGPALMGVLEQDPTMGFVVMRRIAQIISGRLRNTRVALLKTL